MSNITGIRSAQGLSSSWVLTQRIVLVTDVASSPVSLISRRTKNTICCFARALILVAVSTPSPAFCSQSSSSPTSSTRLWLSVASWAADAMPTSRRRRPKKAGGWRAGCSGGKRQRRWWMCASGRKLRTEGHNSAGSLAPCVVEVAVATTGRGRVGCCCLPGWRCRWGCCWTCWAWGRAAWAWWRRTWCVLDCCLVGLVVMGRGGTFL